LKKREKEVVPLFFIFLNTEHIISHIKKKGGEMGRYKFLYFILIAALLSCYKIPSKDDLPEWEIRINIPLGDTMVTARDIVEDTTIDHSLEIDLDSAYNDSLYAVFHYSDTAIGTYYGSGPRVLQMTVKHKVSDNIDTTSSVFSSLAKRVITRVHVAGRCSVDFYGAVVCSIFPPDTFQHFVPFMDTFPVFIPAQNNLDSMMIFPIDSFPLGPYRNRITLYHYSGVLAVDSSFGYAKMPIDFISTGDLIVTFRKAVSVDSTLRTNKDKHFLKRVIVHVIFMNRTTAGFTGNFNIGTLDSSTLWTSHPVTVYPADKDPATGFTYLDALPETTIIEDTLTEEYVEMTDSDSLYWQAELTIPTFGKVFLRPEDWLRMYGWVSVDLWVDPDSLMEGGEE
jgi:hypothetical protein